jgi:putative heme-binding domain-containing protein
MRLTVFLFAISAMAQTPGDVTAGERIFRSHCAECHGLHGEGGRGPNLTTGEFFHGSTDAALARNISRGIPGTEMPGIYHDSNQIAQIVAYVRSLSANTVRRMPKGDPAAGQTLFRSNGCNACHMIGGEDGRLGPDLTFAGSARTPEYLRESILKPAATVNPAWFPAEAATRDGKSISGYLLNEDAWSIQMIDSSERLVSLSRGDLTGFTLHRNQTRMPSYESKLSGADIDNLVAWLSTLRRPARLE